MDRRKFALTLLAAGAAASLAACGRRGPLEPPPYTQQGQEWQRRQNQNRQTGVQPPGSVRQAVQDDQADRGTVDVESQVEGTARAPSDPAAVGQQQERSQSLSPVAGRRRPPGVRPPNQPFILDPLL